EDWNLAVSVLTESGLISAEANGTLDAHPLLREYFALQVRDHHPEAWRAGHGRLFEHLRDTTPYQPDTLEGLQPLYQAVAHGCHAGRLEEARGGIYDRRILRGSGRDGFFSINNLGAFGADLGALACFFDSPWCIVSPSQSKAAQAWLLNEAASRLRAMGRLIEAKEAMQNSIGTDVAEKSWKGAAISASNLSEIERTLGEISASLRDAEKARDFADRSGDPFWRMGTRTNYASALHQVGRRAEALLLFREAELMQAEREPRCPLLHSVQGFAYCDLQLAEAEREAGRRKGIARKVPVLAEAIRKVGARASYAIKIAELNQWLLDIALDHLTLGRAALYRAILEGSDLALARSAIEQAVAGLRRAGTTHHVPKALLTRAWFHFRENNPAAARADLDEAQEIAERGPMPLYLADIALYRGRLFGDRAALAEARRLIVKHGYGRRLGELEDAEAALGAAG
ncbi:MAG TPA: hypothetical protein VN851_11360, partial [Thermoanaerobaculia bacterium]|nr:hypothetical protein [Thermoanaerobaculia bacterium]